MLKNLKHSTVFVSIIMLLLIIFISLAASKPVSSINIKTNGVQKGEVLGSGKWSGLGMGIFSTSSFDDYVDILLTNGITQLRIDIPDYQDTSELAQSKEAVTKAVEKGVKVVWGVSSNPGDDPDYTITAANWHTFRQAILDAAAWAQANGVYEFQIGNEEEYHNDNTTLTDAQLIINLKSVATDVQAIFTRGNVSYTSTDLDVQGWWHDAGRGDIDILAWNVYSNQYGWETALTNMISWWGADHSYITEFSLSYLGLDSYSTDEAVQAAGIVSMIEDIKAAGITRAFFFCWQTNEFGVLKSDGTYRLLWNQAL